MAGDPDLFRILISTDNHLGYLSADEIRGQDTFITIEEVLQTARRLEVDFLLLGGDLFHDHWPSNSTLQRTLQLLSQYCLGPSHTQFETDKSRIDPNYLNKNLRVSLPIFIIHGNHDEPAAQSNVSPLDLMSISHFLNYFGKATWAGDRLVVKPIRLRKGRTTLLLYGIGHMKNEKLHRLFREKLIDFEQPEENAFCVLLLHQNRYKGGGVSAPAQNCILDAMVPDFMHFVLWGHEHDSHVQVAQPLGKDFHIYQPGSSVATSLTEGEALPKHMGLLEVKCAGYRLTSMPYKTVRPLIYLAEVVKPGDFTTSAQAEKYLSEKIEVAIQNLLSVGRTETRPLVRLKVTIEDLDTLSPLRIVTPFHGRVANTDIITIHRRTERTEKSVDAVIREPGLEHAGSRYILQLLREDLILHKDQFTLSDPELMIERLSRVVEHHEANSLEGYFQAVETQFTSPTGKRLREVQSHPKSPSRQRLRLLT